MIVGQINMTLVIRFSMTKSGGVLCREKLNNPFLEV